MARTFMQMASEAMAEVTPISPAETQQCLDDRPDSVLIDVRDLADRRASGMAAGAIPISAGYLPIRADQELPVDWRDERLQDRARPVMTICETGALSAIAAKTLKEMGFRDVAYVEGGTQGWKAAGLPTVPPPDA